MFINKIKHLRRFSTQTINESFYVTTPIFYVNAAPHIGHLYTAVISDTICRYQKLINPESNIHLCTGTDEHGTKIQQAAATHKVPISKYCDDISGHYKDIFRAANIANTDFIRTTEARHKKAVAHFWNELQKRDHIYTAQYSGWYCVSDETFLTDSQLRVNTETGERFSLESGHPAEWTEEANYMFRLNALQNDIIYWVKQENRIRPAKFQKILLDILNEPLPDVSVSRPSNRVHWAIPVPNDETQTVYVWLDALINYLTSAGYPDKKFQNEWPPNIQVIGKDILKFHGIYWPAFLIAAGLEPPQQLFVHSHWTVDGQKMSKSKHNVVDPKEASKIYSMEGLRYFLLREGVAHSDGNFSNTKTMRILNSELADTLGNLLSRGCAKSLNPKQIYPRLHMSHLDEILQNDATAQHLQDALRQMGEQCAQHYNDNNFYLVVDTVMSTLHAANNFFEHSRPWELKSDAKKIVVATGAAAPQPTPPPATSSSSSSTLNSIKVDSQVSVSNSSTFTSSLSTANAKNIENANRLETIIAMTMDTLRLCGIILQPIIPEFSAKLLDKLNVPLKERLWYNLNENFTNKNINKSTSHQYGRVERQLSPADAIIFRRIIFNDDGTIKTIKPQQEGTIKAKQKKEKKKKIAQ